MGGIADITNKLEETWYNIPRSSV